MRDADCEGSQSKIHNSQFAIRNHSAYTLVEVVFVVVIIAIIAAIVIPRSRGSLHTRYLVYTTTRHMAADLRLARRLAIAHGSTNSSGYSFRMIGSVPYTGWRVRDESDASTVGIDKTVPSGVSVSGTQSAITFSTIGEASYSGSDLTITNTGTPTVVTYTIDVIQATGHVAFTES